MNRAGRFVDSAGVFRAGGSRKTGTFAMLKQPSARIQDHFDSLTDPGYIQNRPQSVSMIADFLGVSQQADGIETERLLNVGEDARKPSAFLKSVLRGVTRSWWYNVHVKPRLPLRVTRGLQTVFLRKSPPRPPAPSLDTIDFVISRVEKDADELRNLLGKHEPLSDFNEVRRRFLGQEKTASSPRSRKLWLQ